MSNKEVTTETKSNRLIHETSTYLLQHAHNPVDWYPWGAEAIERAKREEKPIFLSIGYAACHWCHVMEHESFENPETASLMNEYFVNIKVDREERTDLDEIYMKAVQMMTGHGGWPMSVFLTPDLKPFFGGTYFPPEDGRGLPSFKRLLRSIHQAWTSQRQDLLESANELTGHMKLLDEVAKPETDEQLNYNQIERASDKLLKSFDSEWGGFGSAPKFPHTFGLSLCLRVAAPNSPASAERKRQCLEVASISLDRMAYGGMHDQIGGGFARYSVDRKWLIPHFEKMLYDNALLCHTYLEGYALTGRNYWKEVARGILEFVLRELTTADGGFYSSLDADSEGEEGKFYVWNPVQIRATLGSDAKWFEEVFGVTAHGNFEHGTSALHLTEAPEQLAKKHAMSLNQFWTKVGSLSQTLLEERGKRIRPGRDEKVLTSWNSLMITAFVDGYVQLREPKYLASAKRAAEFILQNLMPSGKLLRTWGAGKAKLDGYLDDFAYFAQALLDLASVDPDPKWLRLAEQLSKTMLDQFWDEENHGFYYTSNDHEKLVTRPKSHYDGAIPSGSSVAASVLVRLSKLTGNRDYHDYASKILKLYSPFMDRAPDQFSNFLCALDFVLAKDIEIAVVAPQSGAEAEILNMVATIAHQFIPSKVVLVGQEKSESSPLFADRICIENKVTAYICENFACKAPLTDADKLSAELAKISRSQA